MVLPWEAWRDRKVRERRKRKKELKVFIFEFMSRAVGVCALGSQNCHQRELKESSGFWRESGFWCLWKRERVRERESKV